MSVEVSAVSSVSVTVLSERTGAVVLKGTVSGMPSFGVFSTAKAVFARLSALARASSKVRTKDAPSTAADTNAGAVVSGVLFVTGWSVKVAVSLPVASSSRLSESVLGIS